MALRGRAKTEYMRAYMRRRRSNRSNANVRPSMQERVGSVRPGDGSELDNLRAASERLEVALGGPAVEAIKPFRGECVTCEHLCDGGNDAAACDTEVCPHAEGCIEPETLAAIDAACGEPVRLPERMLTPKPQSYNPMMVGYVPPVD